MKQLIKKINKTTKNKQKTKHYTSTLLHILLITLLICTTIYITQQNNNVNAPPQEDIVYDQTYYVSANGDDTNNGLSENYPFATLSKTATVINNNGISGNYLINVMTDLTSTGCARYYDNNITITSLNDTPLTVTRGTEFDALSDNVRSWYNPAMIELGSGNLTEFAPKLSLTLKNIIFDDAYLHGGAIDAKFRYAPTPYNPSDSGLNYVQDAIVASYANCATIILAKGAELHNFGGMSAIHLTDGATLIMQDGSLITDINSTENTRAISTTNTDYRANGEAAISIGNAHFYMNEGSQITNIANAHSVKLSGSYKCFIDGEIAYMKGSKGMDATDGNQGANHEGRSFKNAVFFNGGTTLNPVTGVSGSAIIGPNAHIHDNDVKCGTVSINRGSNVFVEIYGKINNNNGRAGTRYFLGIGLAAGTNGGGLYVVGGGTIYLEDGSEICNNTIVSSAYGGAANLQQGNSKLIMNGGLISGNSAPTGSGIVVNRNNAYFEMNGGVINNGASAVYLMSDSPQTDGRLILNAGSVSGVTVQNTNIYGTNSQRHVFINEDVLIGTGFLSVANRNVYFVGSNFKIGNPNAATYSTIRSSLPQGWTMPTADSSVIGFWMQKTGTMIFSVPAPTTGTAPNNYNRTLGVYFVAVQATTAAGTVDSSIPLKIYPTSIVQVGNINRIVVSVPLDAYSSGATIALVQPATMYGVINFEGPEMLLYEITAEDYTIGYTASYDMPQGLHAELLTDGCSNENTDFIFTIRPDYRTIPDIYSLTIESELFVVTDDAVWDSNTGEFIVVLKLKDDWTSAINLESKFAFDCIMNAVDFEDGEFLKLVGNLEIVGQNNGYMIYGNEAKTEMIMLKGNLHISKILLGDTVDETADFHFTVTFSDGGTYSGIASGSVITLKGNETILISDIIQGVTYTVVEHESNQNGYTTTFTGESGTISDIQSEAVFVNTRDNFYEYTVTVNNSFANELSGAGTYTEGDTVTIHAGNRDGYVFSGWTVNVTTVIFDDTTNADTFFVMPACDVTVTANWIALKYTITYVLDGGVNDPSNPSSYIVTDLPLKINIPHKTGYIFFEWIVFYANGSANRLSANILPVGTVGDVTLVALWDTTSYNINYELNGGINAVGNPTVYSAKSKFPIEIIDPNKIGFKFLGWNVTYVNGIVESFASSYSIPVGSTGDILLSANWRILMFTVQFVDWNGEILKTELVCYGAAATTPTDPTREGYTFSGWDTAFNNVVSDLIVTAQYTKNGDSGTESGGEDENNGGTTSQPPTTTTKPSTSQPPTTTTPPPSTTPPNSPTPSDNDDESLPMWALLNLIISVIGIILVIIVFICVLLQHKQKQNKTQIEQKNPKNPYTTETKQNQKTQKQRVNIWLLTSFALSIAGIILFFLTENTNLTMTLVDKWTIINAIIFIIELITITLAFKHKKDTNSQKEVQTSN
ncbi:MAG: InlB B-repeat-containing protein [Candidatus Bathyarchaeota archaeon]|nr:InlB B-repeat-containing protein [Candidatus Termiticorpusculum sp.]